MDTIEHGKEFTHAFIDDARRKYDPVKRKEYYERTKKLKGRKKGRSQSDVTREQSKARAADVMKTDQERSSVKNNPSKKGVLQEKLNHLYDAEEQLYKLGFSSDSREMKRLRETKDSVLADMFEEEMTRGAGKAKDFLVNLVKDYSDLAQNLLDPNGKGKRQFNRTMPMDAWERETASIEERIKREKQSKK